MSYIKSLKDGLTKDLKNKWIDALRSGKYQQGHYSLKKPNDIGIQCFCCLGVLCDVYDRTGWHTSPDWTHFNYKGSKYMAPITLLSVQDQDKLIKMNDIVGKSFNEIADYIQEHIISEDEHDGE